jgi:hypothetical protein
MTIYNFSGFHTYNSVLNERTNPTPEEEAGLENKERNSIFFDAKTINTYNLLGALPLVGILTGYRRIQNLDPNATLSIKIYTYVRAIFEILGCGFLFVITIDLSVSLHRHFWTKGTVYLPRESDVTYFDVFKALIKNKQRFLDIDENRIEIDRVEPDDNLSDFLRIEVPLFRIKPGTKYFL